MNRGKLISSCLLLLDLLYSQSTRWRIQSYLHSQSFVPIYPYNTCIKNPFHSRYNRVTATKSPTKCNVPKRVGHAFPIPRSNSLACREKAKRRRISVWKQQNRRPKANSTSMFRHLETWGDFRALRVARNGIHFAISCEHDPRSRKAGGWRKRLEEEEHGIQWRGSWLPLMPFGYGERTVSRGYGAYRYTPWAA